MQRQKTNGRTFFQQKYAAKQETRKYHGEHLTKRQWQNIFKHSLKSVVPMNTPKLASSDGSEYGAGRGSGLDNAEKRRTLPVPYMNQTFAPMERRLDMAIFRAMFASSALQARQFVIHGFVKVNGKKVCWWRLCGVHGGAADGRTDAIPAVHAQPRRHVQRRH